MVSSVNPQFFAKAKVSKFPSPSNISLNIIRTSGAFRSFREPLGIPVVIVIRRPTTSWRRGKFPWWWRWRVVGIPYDGHDLSPESPSVSALVLAGYSAFLTCLKHIYIYLLTLLVLNYAGNEGMREWSIIIHNHYEFVNPSNPQQPIHSLRLAPVFTHYIMNYPQRRGMARSTSISIIRFLTSLELRVALLGWLFEHRSYNPWRCIPAGAEKRFFGVKTVPFWLKKFSALYTGVIGYEWLSPSAASLQSHFVNLQNLALAIEQINHEPL